MAEKSGRLAFLCCCNNHSAEGFRRYPASARKVDPTWRKPCSESATSEIYIEFKSEARVPKT